MAAVTIWSDFWSPQNISLSLFPLFPHLFAMKWWDQMPWSQFSECWVLSHFSILLFHFHQEALYFFFIFCHKGAVICISEVISISPITLDSGLCFIQPVFHMINSVKLNKQGDNIQPWHTLFLIWNLSVVPCLVLTVASWPAYRFLKRHNSRQK